jgi:hypothetical protein
VPPLFGVVVGLTGYPAGWFLLVAVLLATAAQLHRAHRPGPRISTPHTP